MLVTDGCASTPFPGSSLTGGVSEVKIDESLTPKVVSAKPGDEVRWVNTTSGSAGIVFVDPLDGRVSCQKGFVSAGWSNLFRPSEPNFFVVATVQSYDFASLCFSTPGTFHYTVRMKDAITSTAITGTVTIEKSQPTVVMDIYPVGQRRHGPFVR